MKLMLNKVEQQKNYEYRDSFRWVLAALVGMLALSVILTAAVAYKAIFPVKAKYYASMTTGQVIPLRALSEPVVTNKYILEWAALATRAAFNLDFVNYEKQLNAASIYFTKNGWDGFNKALTDSNLLETVKSKKLVISAVVPETPVIRFEGVIGGRHFWRITLPILITFGSASEERKRELNVTMIVSRVPVLDMPEGIQISDFEAKSL
jgi:intracellular multiplication protein IcmL